jgi:hypothetical protein
MPHPCERPGCGATVADGMLCCRPCWFRIPKPLRSAVWSTWGALRRNRTLETVRAYREARDAAIASVTPVAEVSHA